MHQTVPKIHPRTGQKGNEPAQAGGSPQVTPRGDAREPTKKEANAEGCSASNDGVHKNRRLLLELPNIPVENGGNKVQS